MTLPHTRDSVDQQRLLSALLVISDDVMRMRPAPVAQLVRRVVAHGRDRPRVDASNMAALETAGAEFRAAEAITLRAERLTIEAIADLFGVTRQPISPPLRQQAASRVGGGGSPASIVAGAIPDRASLSWPM